MGGYYPVQIEDSTDARKIINIISVEAGVPTATTFVNETKKKILSAIRILCHTNMIQTNLRSKGYGSK